MGEIKHFFETRKVEMTDGSVLWEIVTPDGERVAAASTEEALTDLEIVLNLALTDAFEADPDLT